jgi:hypothetical protein
MRLPRIDFDLNLREASGFCRPLINPFGKTAIRATGLPRKPAGHFYCQGGFQLLANSDDGNRIRLTGWIYSYKVRTLGTLNMIFPKKTTYRLPSELRKSMLVSVAREFGKKGKSRWIKQAITDLIAKDTGLSSVGLGEDYESNDASDVIVIDSETFEKLQTAMMTIRRQDPLYAGVQSAVIRAAIRMRLMGGLA